MNREILFRGKDKFDNTWTYGFLYIDERNGKHWILTSKNTDKDMHMDEVFPETVGEYFGVIGKNEVKIFEGDIVEAWSAGTKGRFVIKFRNEGAPTWILFPAWQSRKFWHIHASEYNKGKKFIDVEGKITISDKDGYYDDGIEKIGNIHDNPELLNSASVAV